MNSPAISEICNPPELPCDSAGPVLEIYAYWRSIRPSPALLPGRKHLKLREIAPLLRNIWLADVQRNPYRFRYRLLGTKIDHLIGNLKGAWLDEAHDNFERSVAYTEFVDLIEGRVEFLYFKGPPLFSVNRNYIWLERVCVPLADNGRDIDTILGLTLYGPARREGVDP